MNMQVAKNTVITLDYHVKDPDGEVVDEGREPPAIEVEGGGDEGEEDRRGEGRPRAEAGVEAALPGAGHGRA